MKNREDYYFGKYKKVTTRLQNTNYAKRGAYFITICTKERNIDYFGEVIDNEIILSNLGKIVTDCWENIPVHFEHIKLDEFVVMPDHLHGILVFKENYISDQFCSKYGKLQKGSIPVVINQFKSSVTRIFTKQQNSPHHLVEPRHGVADLNKNVDDHKNKSNQNNTSDLHNNKFKRQSRYHERIIKNQPELLRIRIYIRNNPQNQERN